jgi:hypothetical protein
VAEAAAIGSRIPLVSESTATVAGYLAAERDLGRVAAGADIGTLAPTVIGARAPAIHRRRRRAGGRCRRAGRGRGPAR